MTGLKVVHVLASLSYDRGGPTRSVMGLAAAQARAGATVIVVAGDAANPFQVSDRDRVSVVHGRHFASLFSLPDAKLTRALNRAIESADIVHVHGVWNATSSLAMYLARRAMKRYVIGPHGMFDTFNVRQNYPRKMLWRLVVDRKNFSGAAGLHFLDEAERRDCFPAFRVGGQAVLEWPNGVAYEDIAAAALAGAKPADEGAIRLLFLGRLHRIKGLELQLDAVAALRARGLDVRLSLVGPDYGALRQLEAYAGARQIADAVDFAGPLYDDVRYALLRNASAVLLTSHYECNSVTAAETFAAGGLLLATETCHLDNAARFGAAVVVPRDPESVAAAIADIVSDRARNQATRERAQAFAREKLSWPAAAQATLDFYKDVLRPR